MNEVNCVPFLTKHSSIILIIACAGNLELVERAPVVMAPAGEGNISRKKSVLRRTNKLKKAIE